MQYRRDYGKGSPKKPIARETDAVSNNGGSLVTQMLITEIHPFLADE